MGIVTIVYAWLVGDGLHVGGAALCAWLVGDGLCVAGGGLCVCSAAFMCSQWEIVLEMFFARGWWEIVYALAKKHG